MLAHDLHAHRALPGDHFRIVVWVHEGERAFAFQPQRLGVRLGVRVAVQAHLGAARAHRIDLDARRGDRHDDGGAAAQALRGKGHALRMVARTRGDHAAL